VLLGLVKTPQDVHTLKLKAAETMPPSTAGDVFDDRLVHVSYLPYARTQAVALVKSDPIDRPTPKREQVKQSLMQCVKLYEIPALVSIELLQFDATGKIQPFTQVRFRNRRAADLPLVGILRPERHRCEGAHLPREQWHAA
jgi:hypothetical protein